MKILVAKTFGIGNSVCAIPMIKAIQIANPTSKIDILVGNHPDDFGARLVFENLGEFDVYTETALEQEYDIAICAIPFSGRFQNGIHFNAKKVMDCRGRPEHSQVMGFSSWKKHEILYQMENAYELGYEGPVPDCSFYDTSYLVRDSNKVYVGVGYKKDSAGFWKVKHWGNENFAELIKLILQSDSKMTVVSTGDLTDMQLSMGPISRMVSDSRYESKIANLEQSFFTMAHCGSYIGNDTGMAHVAASMNANVTVLFKMENASTKSRPWCDNYRVVEGFNRDVSPREMFEKFQEMRNVQDSKS